MKKINPKSIADTLGLSLYAIERLTSTLDNLVIKEEVIENRSNNSAGVLSSYYLHELITKAPITREEIYTIIQTAAFENQETNLDFDIIINRLLKEKGLEVAVDKVDMKNLKTMYRKTAKEVRERVLSSYPLA